MVRLDGRAPEPRPDEPLTVRDDAPWVDIAFRNKPNNSFLERMGADSGGKLLSSPDRPDDGLYWYRWNLWSPKAADERRRGAFAIGGHDGGSNPLCVYVEPGRIFSDSEHQRMVDDILNSLCDATWETRKSIPGVRVTRGTGREPIFQLIDEIRREYRDAASVMRNPAVELVPTRPGERGLVGAPSLTYSTDLPENHVVGWWAMHRTRDLLLAREEVQSQLGRRKSEFSRVDASLARERSESLATAVREGEQMLSEIDVLRRLVSPWTRAELPRLQLIGPAVTRDPRRRRLIDAIRFSVDRSTIAASMLLSRLRERTFAALFEIWGAVTIAHALCSLGWRTESAPCLRWIDEWSPERITWSFSLGTERLDVIYEPHAERTPLAPQETDGPYRNRTQRAIATIPSHHDPGLFATTPAASPDYAILLYSGDRVAFTIGDAIASDFSYLKKADRWTSIAEKIHKLGSDYARNLVWWSPGHATSCSAPAAFVLLPGDGDQWIQIPRIADELERQDVILLGGVPRDPGDGESISATRFDRIINTLRAHARDGSNRVPVMPGICG